MKKGPVFRLFITQLLLALVAGGAGALLLMWDALAWLRDKEGHVLIAAMIIAWHLPLMEKMVDSMTPESYPYTWFYNFGGSIGICGFLIIGLVLSVESAWALIPAAFASVWISIVVAEVMACDALNSGAKGTRKEWMLKTFPYGIGIIASILRP